MCEARATRARDEADQRYGGGCGAHDTALYTPAHCAHLILDRPSDRRCGMIAVVVGEVEEAVENTSAYIITRAVGAGRR
jgi:hypothetical protein